MNGGRKNKLKMRKNTKSALIESSKRARIELNYSNSKLLLRSRKKKRRKRITEKEIKGGRGRKNIFKNKWKKVLRLGG